MREREGKPYPGWKTDLLDSPAGEHFSRNRREKKWKQRGKRQNRDSYAMEIQYKTGFEISRKYEDKV